ncbi:Glycosyl hydrolase family 71 domain containing protein [Rhypophila decipiens]
MSKPMSRLSLPILWSLIALRVPRHVGNTASYTVADWQNDMSLAQAAHIDGFVLNMARNESTNGASVANAFAAANNLGSNFKLLFSFDYAGNGLWDKADVISAINTYAPNPAYYRRGSQPLVSTFEGPAASADWPDIKAATNCFFMPSWSSLGAGPAWAKGTADGLFSWAAWPEGPNSMSTFTDNSYRDALGSAPYMMPVAPWFYTNMPGFRKNWLWRGDSLWFDRWVQVMTLQPDYVQIISWNDYGECHHIGPLNPKAYVAFDAQHGRAPLNYALGKSHDGWRAFLPFLIDMAKYNTTSFNQENVVAWYKEHPGSACGTGGTTGNTASQLQQTYAPAMLAQDRVFYAALLGSSATVTVSIGGQTIAGTWTITPSNNIGLFRGSVATGGRTGAVVVTISRSGTQMLSASGNPITNSCPSGITNWNANVIAGTPRSISSVSPLSLSSSVCTSGFGDPRYLDLCYFACKYGYCPSVCTCTSVGSAITRPTSQNKNGCPAPGIDNTYLGLCSFGCNYGYCPPSLCQVYPAGHVCTAPNPTPPPVPVCTSGRADGEYAELCSFACYYGFCPPEICTCVQASQSGGPAAPQVVTGVSGGPAAGIDTDYGLCQWACARGNCPANLCSCSGAGCSSIPGSEGGPAGGGRFFEFPTNLAIVGAVRLPAFGGFQPSLGGLRWGMGKPLSGRGLDGIDVCTLRGRCTDQTNSWESRCSSNEVKLGWDRDGCEGDHQGKSICCPASDAVNECSWRGSGLDCNGQCHEGEGQLWSSQWGGGPGADEGFKCNRGVKAFCCKSLEHSMAMRGCRWSGCWSGCRADTEVKVLSKDVHVGLCLPGVRTTDLCCPKPAALKECLWRGTWPDCEDAKCMEDEIVVDRYTYGASGNGCLWGRQKVACCKVEIPKPPVPGFCPAIDWCARYPLLCAMEEDGSMGSDPNGQGFSSMGMSRMTLFRRGGPREFKALESTGLNSIWSRGYLSRGLQFKYLSKLGTVPYYLVSQICESADILRKETTDSSDLPGALDTEHPLDLQIFMRFLESCVTGNLPGGARSVLTRITPEYFNEIFSRDLQLPAGASMARISPTSPDILNPMERVFEAFGSVTNPHNLLLADRQMNIIKGKLIGFKFPLTLLNFGTLVDQGLAGDFSARLDWISWIKKTIAVFKYFQHGDFQDSLGIVQNSINDQFRYTEMYTVGGTGLRHHWMEFLQHLLWAVGLFARDVVLEYIKIVQRKYDQAQPPDYAVYMSYCQSWLADFGNMVIPGYIP